MKQTPWRGSPFVLAALALVLTATTSGAQEPADLYLIEVHGSLPVELEDLVAEAGGVLHRVHPEIGLAVARSQEAGFAASLEAAQRVRSVTRDMRLAWTPDPAGGALRPTEPVAAAASDPTAALLYPCQWNLRQIDVPGAWDRGAFGSPDVRVAVLDTGVDPDHQDLLGRVDVAASRSFVSSSPCGALDTASVLDHNFHGAFVSGIIAANGVGVAGVAPQARIVGVKVLDCLGTGTFADLVAGILYAASLPRVAVINMSLSAYLPKSLPGAGRLAASLDKAVAFANARGKLTLSAAGGNAADLDHDRDFILVPGQSANGIAIWAGDVDGALAGYSNHGVSGTWVGAGGGDSTPGSPELPLPGCALPPACHGFVTSVCSSHSLFFGCGGGASYLTCAAGTSFSAAAVSGVAALAGGRIAETDAPDRLDYPLLSQTADDLGRPGVDNTFSHGRVNAAAAVEAVDR